MHTHRDTETQRHKERERKKQRHEDNGNDKDNDHDDGTYIHTYIPVHYMQHTYTHFRYIEVSIFAGVWMIHVYDVIYCLNQLTTVSQGVLINSSGIKHVMFAYEPSKHTCRWHRTG